LSGSTDAQVGIVWRDSEEGHSSAIPETSRLFAIAAALQAVGLSTTGIAYCEARSRDVFHDLLACDAVLVWVDPLTDGRDRSDLDTILRAAAARGVLVSGHPDVILKMGTKEVLVQTRHLGWGSDVKLYTDFDAFRFAFPGRLRANGVRVVKRFRGNGGQGVWKVFLLGDDRVRLQQATDRDGTAKETTLTEFVTRCERYFENDGRLIDQAFQPRIVEGMVRSYMCGTELVGFARQFPALDDAGRPLPDTFGLPAAKTMLPPDAPQFAGLRASLEQEWIGGLASTLSLASDDLPALWDADFLFGPKDRDGQDSFVLCEINASCVTPFPPEAPAKIADFISRELAARMSRR
jgi:hypothetical protein